MNTHASIDVENEILDIINKDNEVIDRQARSVVHSQGLPHRISAVLLRDQDGKYLIPTASEIKLHAGGLFHSAAGHVPSGESYRASAKRELREETGVEANEEDFILLGNFWLEMVRPGRIEKERFEVFQVDYHPTMGNVQFNDEQTNEQWLSDEELKNIYHNNPEQLSHPLRLSCEHIFKFQS